MRYSSLHNNQKSTLLRGPRGRRREILGSAPVTTHRQVSSTPVSGLKTAPAIPKPLHSHEISIPTNQLMGQIIQHSIPVSPSTF
jgi:hypothetical protein